MNCEKHQAEYGGPLCPQCVRDLARGPRAELAAALERDLRQLGLDDGAAFVRAQQAEIERLTSLNGVNHDER